MMQIKTTYMTTDIIARNQQLLIQLIDKCFGKWLQFSQQAVLRPDFPALAAKQLGAVT